MVDVSAKPDTVREATAEGWVRLKPAHEAALGALPKGDALAVAQIAGIQAGKRTADLIPLCHPLPLSHLEVKITPHPGAIHILATAKTTGPTGVEMEAYCAVSVAAVTLIDMLKGVDPDLTIDGIRLLRKSGGKRDWLRS